ncbi:MAG: ABC transporter substrate-binding protein [bacterium]
MGVKKLLGVILVALSACGIWGVYASGKVKVQYLSHTTNISEINLYKELGEMFTKKSPDIEVDVTSVPERFYEQLQIMISAGTPPDATFLANWFVPPFVARRALTNLDPFVERDNYDLAKFFSTVLDACRVEGKLYGLPRHPSPAAIFYNKNLFDQAGLSYPDETWTWEKEFMEAAKKLTKTDDRGRHIQWGVFTSRDVSHNLLPIIYGLGGRILDEKMSKCVIDTPESIAAIQWLGDLWVKHKVAITPDQSAGLAGDPFVLGKVAMVTNIYPFIIQQAQFVKDFEWDVAILPEGKGGRWNRAAVGVHAMPAGAKHPNEAWEWLKFLATEEAQLKIAASGLVMPSIKDLCLSEKFLNPPTGPKINRKAFVDGLTKTKLVKEIFHPKWSQIEQQVIVPEFDLVFLGKKSASEACKKIAIEANKILEER